MNNNETTMNNDNIALTLKDLLALSGEVIDMTAGLTPAKRILFEVDTVRRVKFGDGSETIEINCICSYADAMKLPWDETSRKIVEGDAKKAHIPEKGIVFRVTPETYAQLQDGASENQMPVEGGYWVVEARSFYVDEYVNAKGVTCHKWAASRRGFIPLRATGRTVPLDKLRVVDRKKAETAPAVPTVSADALQ